MSLRDMKRMNSDAYAEAWDNYSKPRGQSESIPINIRKLHPAAVVPQYATELAAGFDLVAVEDVVVAPGKTEKVPIGLAFEIPPGYEMQIRPRSGVSLNTKLRVANSPGTIDTDFRGEVAVLVDNTHTGRCPDGAAHRYGYHVDGTKARGNFTDGSYLRYGTYIIRKGDRIAQGVIAPVKRVEFTVVDELSETARGDGGFGHTGARAENPTYREEWAEVGE